MDWLAYFHERVAAFDFHPWLWLGDDENLRAFASRESFAQWYGQPPGSWHVHGVSSYRDESFYVRELATLSMLVKPRRVVEFGTALGIGAVLLRILNPDAELTTIDIADGVYLPNGKTVGVGYLARIQEAGIDFVQGDSASYCAEGVDLTFIDADHSYEGVALDSICAWDNRNQKLGAIIWHDYNERHPGNQQAVNEFCTNRGLTLNSLSDSCTVWVTWGPL
jgi:hypothetical protein